MAYIFHNIIQEYILNDEKQILTEFLFRWHLVRS